VDIGSLNKRSGEVVEMVVRRGTGLLLPARDEVEGGVPKLLVRRGRGTSFSGKDARRWWLR
jgi:hypothetical protein